MTMKQKGEKFAKEWVPVYSGKEAETRMLQDLLKQNNFEAEVIVKHGKGFAMRAGTLLEEFTLVVPSAEANDATDFCKAFMETDENTKIIAESENFSSENFE